VASQRVLICEPKKIVEEGLGAGAEGCVYSLSPAAFSTAGRPAPRRPRRAAARRAYAMRSTHKTVDEIGPIDLPATGRKLTALCAPPLRRPRTPVFSDGGKGREVGCGARRRRFIASPRGAAAVWGEQTARTRADVPVLRFTRGSDSKARCLGRWSAGGAMARCGLGCSGREFTCASSTGARDGERVGALLPLPLQPAGPHRARGKVSSGTRTFANLRVLRRGRPPHS